MREACAIISAALILVAAPPYVIDTLKGVTKPERMTWSIFSALGVIAFVSQVGLGASWSLLFSGLDTAASIMIFGLSLKYGVGGHTKQDIGALVVASIGVAIAYAFKQPLISLAGVIVADASGTVLTIRKAFLEPESETTVSWVLVGTASAFGVLAVGSFSAPLLLYPAYLLVANYAVPIAQLFGRPRRRVQPSKAS